MAFRVFDYLDQAMVKSESKQTRTAKTPSVWPSEASALRLDPISGPIVGKCHRASLLRIIGTPVTNQIDAVGAWRWVLGRMVEDHVTKLASISEIFVASGVRTYIEDLYLPLELDLIVLDPKTKQGCIIECKSFYGYMAKADIVTNGKPKLENLMQASMYLLEIKTGKRLKEIIAAGLADRRAAEAAGITNSRNRITVNEELLAQMDDGPLMTKLIYIARDEGVRAEFDCEVKEDFDGTHYPVVDGNMWKIFTIDSIYERYRTLQKYWFRMRQEAYKRLQAKGITKPAHVHLVLQEGDQAHASLEDVAALTDDQIAEEAVFYTALEREMRSLPDTFWPPAEYQFSYSPEKIERLFAAGHLGKTKYNDYKKKKAGKERIGDWQCSYCDYRKICIPRQSPNLAYLIADLDNMTLEETE